ncbi:hypothetical protein HN784_01950 [bacterium]|jgi:capsular polysaccharide biosynthesis protein|nr:hypothetical protein [bacterium]MBT4124029.1 hypothetical protein [Candidatus Paceibacterota bacterium]MBT4251054.1 hypothetical protein [bacterium]MBT4597959.1 hypothetical protein [bacterium]MBT6753472.1 hypothetical protein [bacterium]
MDLKFIISKRQTIIVISLVFLLVATIFTLLQPVRYSAKSKVLVIPKFNRDVDPYAIARSRTYISEILAEVITTYSFYDEVAKEEFGVNRGYFEKKPEIDQVAKKWKSVVSASSAGDSGMIEITVKHSNMKQAENISVRIFKVLKNRHTRFHSGENVRLKIVDSSIIGLTSPNTKLNFTIAFIAGLGTAIAYIVIFPAPENDLNIFKKKKSNLLEIKTMKELDK